MLAAALAANNVVAAVLAGRDVVAAVLARCQVVATVATSVAEHFIYSGVRFFTHERIQNSHVLGSLSGR